MKKDWSLLEKFRTQIEGIESNPGEHFGLFMIRRLYTTLRIIASDGDYKAAGLDKSYAWEHVSVSVYNRTPTWEEMCKVKDLFWDEDEVVMQLHPAKKDYVNFHPFTLHLWKPILDEIPMPPTDTVGPRNVT